MSDTPVSFLTQSRQARKDRTSVSSATSALKRIGSWFRQHRAHRDHRERSITGFSVSVFSRLLWIRSHEGFCDICGSEPINCQNELTTDRTDGHG